MGDKKYKVQNVKFSGRIDYNQEMGDRPKPSGPGVARVGHLEKLKSWCPPGVVDHADYFRGC